MLHNTQSLVITENRRDLETLTATAIDSAVTGFTRAGLAFQQGNNAAGGVEIARSLSSVFTTVANFSRFGKAAGPAGIVLTIMGEALSLVAFFLDTFVVTKAESRESALFDHIEKMIRGIYAENIEDHLNATIEALQTGGDGLAKTAAKYPGSVETWDHVGSMCPTLRTGYEFTELIATEGWLQREANQRGPGWENIFEAYCCATARQAENYSNGLLALKTHLTEEELQSAQASKLGDRVDLQRQIAMNAITGYANHRNNWINNTIRLPMVNNVNTWRVGESQRLYFRRQTFVERETPETTWQMVAHEQTRVNCFDGHTAMALGPGDRVWIRGLAGAPGPLLYSRVPQDPVGGFLYTLPPSDAQGVVDFCVVSEDRTGNEGGQISTVYYIQGQQVRSFQWDEAKRSATVHLTLPSNDIPLAIAATKGNRYYTINNHNTLSQNDLDRRPKTDSNPPVGERAARGEPGEPVYIRR